VKDFCTSHVSPPSSVRRILPRAPTARPRFASKSRTPKRSSGTSSGTFSHETPASAVRSSVAFSPTTTPCASSAKQTPKSRDVTPVSRGDQRLPPVEV
jgi:hypothetical protein